MEIVPLASTVSDNFFYLVVDGDEGLLVDPIDPDIAVEVVRSRSLDELRILATHGHWDHVGANETVKEKLGGCKILASRHADQWTTPHDEAIGEGDHVMVGGAAFRVIFTPGHTDGHISLYNAGHLLSGDVLFVGGCGNCRFGGDPGVLYRTFRDEISKLPDGTTFYPGHDYSEKNLKFALHVEPDNEHARELLEEASAKTREDGPFLTTLGVERAYNPFHRTDDEVLQVALRERFPDAFDGEGADESEATFRALRALRDDF